MQSGEKLSIYKKLSADLFSCRCKYNVWSTTHRTKLTQRWINELHLTRLRTEYETKILQTTKITEELQEISRNRYTDFINQIFKSYWLIDSYSKSTRAWSHFLLFGHYVHSCHCEYLYLFYIELKSLSLVTPTIPWHKMLMILKALIKFYILNTCIL